MNGVWTQKAQLLAGDGLAYDYFGWSVSLSGDTALIGAIRSDEHEMNCGSAYVFLRLPCSGDLDGDRDVDQADLEILLADWGCGGGNCRGDADGDGDTGLADLALLLARFNQPCP